MNAIVDRINKHMNESFHTDNDGRFSKFVCVVCDVHLQKHQAHTMRRATLEKHRECLKLQEIGNIPPEVLSQYRYNGEGSTNLLKEALLSPKANYNSRCKTFVICQKCLSSILQGITPPTAICNGFTIGRTPEVLECLTEVELAFIAPVRTHAHVLHISGGHDGIKGFHSLIKTNVEKTSDALASMDTIEDFPQRVFVILTVIMSGINIISHSG